MGLFRRRRGADDPSRWTGDASAKNASGSMTAFAKAARFVTSLDDARIRAEYEDLSGTWKGPRLVTGSLEEISEVMRANLENDARARGCADFKISLNTDESYIQVSAINLQRGRFFGHRVWRGPDSFALFSSAADALAPPTGTGGAVGENVGRAWTAMSASGDRTVIRVTLSVTKPRPTVPAEYLQELAAKTKPATLEALARRYGGDWADEISGQLVQEGPEITYYILGVKLRDTSYGAMSAAVESEFGRHWNRALTTTPEPD